MKRSDAKQEELKATIEKLKAEHFKDVENLKDYINHDVIDDYFQLFPEEESESNPSQEDNQTINEMRARDVNQGKGNQGDGNQTGKEQSGSEVNQISQEQGGEHRGDNQGDDNPGGDKA